MKRCLEEIKKSPWAAMDALIRHYFDEDPEELENPKYYQRAAEALFLEERNAAAVARGIVMAFGEK